MTSRRPPPLPALRDVRRALRGYRGTPAEFIELLVARGLLPASWAGDAAAPGWWCAVCYGTGVVRDPVREEEECLCEGGVADSPMLYEDVAAVAALGVAALARVESVVGEAWPGARIGWRAMERDSLQALHLTTAHKSHVATAFAVQAHYEMVQHEPWDEVCPYGDGGDYAEERRAWPYLCELARIVPGRRLDVHLLDVVGRTVFLAAVAAFDLP